VGSINRCGISRRDPHGLGQVERLRKFPHRLGQFPLSQSSEGPCASGELRSRPFPEISRNSECPVFLPVRNPVWDLEGIFLKAGPSKNRVAKLDQQKELHPSDHVVHLHGKIIEDCVATRRAPTLFDECFKSLQISLNAQRHHAQCIFCMFGETLRVILQLQHDV
jgi:hypothetical protein